VIDIILLTHNRLENTIQCLDALYQNTTVPFKLTVIDDSTDLTPEYFVRLKRDNINYVRPDVVIKSGNQAINIGVKLTQSDPLVFLTNSTFVEPDWLPVALRIMGTDPKVGLVGFKILSPRTNRIMEAGYGIGRDQAAHRWTHIREVDAVGWAVVLFRRAALTELDEDYYIGFRGVDDTDNCYEMRGRGWKIMYNGFGSAFHTPRSSAGLTTQAMLDTNENIYRFRRKWRKRYKM